MTDKIPLDRWGRQQRRNTRQRENAPFPSCRIVPYKTYIFRGLRVTVIQSDWGKQAFYRGPKGRDLVLGKRKDFWKPFYGIASGAFLVLPGGKGYLKGYGTHVNRAIGAWLDRNPPLGEEIYINRPWILVRKLKFLKAPMEIKLDHILAPI